MNKVASTGWIIDPMVYLEWALLEDQKLHYKRLRVLENVQHLLKINLNRTDIPPNRINKN